MRKDRSGHNQDGEPVESLRIVEEVNRIRSNLYPKPRDLLLFDLATQTGARIKDLLTLRVRDLVGLKVGESLPIRYSTRQMADLILNDTVYETFQRYWKEVGLQPEDYVFKSKKGSRPLNLSSVSSMINGWFEAAQVNGARGARSLRKIWEQFKSCPSDSTKGTEKVNSLGFLEPIVTNTTQEKVYQQLFDAIVSGKIPPGTKLTVNNICTRFGVSPMPVRMAMNKLQAKGFVSSQQKKASVVMDLSEQSLDEMIRIRIALETLAAKLSYQVCSSETLRMAEGLVHAFAQTKTLEDFSQVNREFHITIFRDAHSPMLQGLIADLIDKMTPYVVLLSVGADPVDNGRRLSLQLHRSILDGIREKNLDVITKWIEADIAMGVGGVRKEFQRRREEEAFTK